MGSIELSSNTISGSGTYGLALDQDNLGGATNNNIIGNTISNTSGVGIWFSGGGQNGNRVYRNNFVNNGQQAVTNGSVNTWSEPYPVGGNNWTPFAGAVDTRYGDQQNLPVKDGVSDVPFALDAGNKDAYPFMNQNGWLVDTIPPRPIKDVHPDLTFSNIGWSAPGDDWDQGDMTLSSRKGVYDIRVAATKLTQANFETTGTETISPVKSSPTFQDGIPTAALSFPNPNGFNFVAIKSTDAAGNTSSISNPLLMFNPATQQVSYLTQSPEPTPIASILSIIPGVQLNFASPADQNAIFQLAQNVGNAPIGSVYLCSGNTSPLTFPPPGATVTFSYASFGISDPTALRILKTDASNMVVLPTPTIDSVNQTVSDSIGSCSFFVLATIPTDSLPPRTALNIGLPNHGSAPVAVNTFTPLSFVSTDDFRVVGDSAGVGVAATYDSVDGSPFALVASSFTISAEGLHSIRFYSVDNAGHQETVETSTVAVDHTPPVTQVSVSSPVFYAVDGSTYVSPASDVGFSVTDPLSAGIASGPQSTFYTVDAGGLTQYYSSFTLTEGAHALTFQSSDWVGNNESLKSVTLKADGTPPSTQLVIQGTQTVNGGVLYVNYGAVFGFAAQDTISHGVASGVKQTLYNVDGGAFGPFQAAFALAAGTHTLAYQSIDNVGNLEIPRVSTFTVLPNDVLPPRTTLIVGRPQYGASPLLVSSATPFGLSAVDDALTVGDGVGSGIAQRYYAIDGGAFLALASSFTVSGAGSHLIRYYSVDLVGNTEAVRASTVAVDDTPPATSLAVSTPLYAGYVSPSTVFSLSAVDPIVSGVASGVAGTFVSSGTAPAAAYAGPFALAGPEGAKTISFYSKDNLSNAEVVQSTTVFLDATPPVTTVSIGASSYTYLGAIYFTPQSPVSISAADPALSVGVPGSGVARVLVAVDGGAYKTVSAPLTFADGLHSIQYQSVDNIGNVGSVRYFTLRSDGTPPVTQLAIQGTQIVSGGILYVSTGAVFGLTAQDPISHFVASGVNQTLYSVDGGALGPYRTSFSLALGTHTIAYQSVDNVGNVETLHVTSLMVRPSDILPPRTTLIVGQPQYGTSPLLVTFATPFGLSAVDDAVTVGDGAGSGVAQRYYAIDGGAFLAFASSFTISGAGSHLIRYYSVDLVGNTEAVHTSTVAVDDTPPATSLAISTPLYAGYVSPSTVFSLLAVDPIISGVASGVGETFVSSGTAPAAAYAGPFTLAGPEGAKTISYDSKDTLANTEVVQSTTVFLDATPPVTSLLIAGGHQLSVSGGVYVSADARLALTAIDPGAPGAASGVAFTRWQDNGGAFQVYGTSIALSEGTHAVAYQSQDNVQNLEVLRSTVIFVDATAPNSAASVGAPSYTASDGTLYIGTSTPVSITASDPPLPGGHAGSGVARIEVSVDSAAYVAYPAPLTFAEGRHLVLYRAVDQTGNIESAHALALSVDATAPVTTLAVSAPSAGGFVSAATLFSLSAVDPVVGGVASGVAATRYSLDGGAFAAYAAPFGFAGADGAHVISYQSVDDIGNAESVRSATFQLDQTPPIATAHVGVPSYTASDGTLYVAPATPMTFTAADAASGVDRIEVAVDGGGYATYSSTLTFAEGRHTVLYRAVDKVGNVEAALTLSLQSDATPSVTAFAPSAAFFTANSHDYAPVGFFYTLTANDPASNNVASGLAFTRYALDGAAFQTYVSTFGLVEGVRQIAFQSQDNVGNLELAKSATVYVDATSPLTTLLVVGGRQFPGPDAFTFYASSDTRLALPAVDPVVNGAASDVAFTQYQDNGGAFQTYLSSLSLAEGAHRLGYQSSDNVRNQEAPRSTNVWVDATPPATTASIGSPTFTAADGTIYVAPATPITFAAVDPALPTGQPGSGLNRIETSLDGAPFTPYAAALTLAEGRHTIVYRAVDDVGNVEAARSIALQSDATPPLTALAVSAPNYQGFVSSSTLLTLSAADPIVNGVASGVAATRYRVNGGTFAAAPSAFRLSGPDGAYAIDYQSQDNVGNLEVVRSTSVLLDQTPPVTSVQIGAPNFVAADGTQYVGPATPVALSAADPVVNGAASGVDRIEVAVDGGPFTAYTSPLTFAEGRHAIQYRAIDRVGNVEAAHTLLLQSDNTPPVTAFQPSGAYFTAAGRNYAPLSFNYALPAQDPVANGVASGVAATLFRVDAGAFTRYVSAFGLTEGVRQVAFQSSDNVSNEELLKSATVYVDATAPVTALTIGQPQFAAPSGTLFVGPAAAFALAAQDPVVQGAASGVSAVSVRVDASAYSLYSASFTLTPGDGLRTVGWFAVDNVGNAETPKISTVALDATPPLTSLLIVGGRQFPGPNAAAFYASSDTRLALPAADPMINGAASGVAFTQYQDNGGAFQTFAAPFGLPEGAHALGYQSQDRVANLEVLRSTTVLIDATPPVSTVHIGTPLFVASDGTNYITPVTPITFSAADPALGGTATPGSGVSRIEAAIDGGAFATYTAALTFAEGRHTILFRSIDDVGNVEAAQTLNVRSDNTSPQTALAVIGGKQATSTTANSFYASADTHFGLPAVDPIVGNVASGVAFTRYQDNGGAFQAFAASVTLSEGSHLLAYQSQDNVGNLEVLRSTTVLVDATPPVSAAAIGLPLFVAADGTKYIAPATPVTLSAFDPTVNGVASGMDRIEASIDGAAYATYASTLTFAEGRHTVLFRAVDRVGNVEAAHTLLLQSDNTPPLTALTLVGGRQAAGPSTGSFYASADTRYALPSVDPVVNGTASGVAFTRYQDNGGAFQTFTSPFSLAEGSHAISYQSQDNVGHLEVARSTTVLVDVTAPKTTVSIGLPLFVAANGVNYITPTTPVTFSAVDPTVSGVASGVDRVEVNIDGAGFVAYGAALTFAEGRHTVLFRAIDRVGNVEAAQTLALQSDNTPPATAFQPSGTLFTVTAPEGPRSYAPAQFTYSLPAVDPVVNNVASGVALTRYRAGQVTNFASSPSYAPGPFQAFAAPLNLAEGIRRVDFQSQDDVGNLELLKSATVFVDATPPATALAIGGPKFDPGNGQPVFIAAPTQLSLSAVDPAVQEVASGVNAIFFHRNADPFVAYSSSFTLPLPDGFKTVAWYAVDNVGNQELTKATTVFLDNTPPQTGLAVIGGHQFPESDAVTFYASSDTRLALPAFDPIVGGAASGLAFTQYQDNGGAFQTFASAFGLPEGVHALGYRSQDRVANLEVLRSTTALIDATPPVSTAHIGTPLFVASDGTNYITPATPITFTAADPALAGTATPGSGVSRIETAIDGGAFAAYTAALTFAEGRHTILFRSIDNVGNVEAAQTLNVRSDNTSPQTALAVIGGKQASSTTANSFYASADTHFGLPAADPIAGNVASGVAFTRWQDNGGAFLTFTAPFSLVEGSHAISYQSQDNVGNLEVLRSTTVLVDATPPVSTVTIGLPLFVAADGTKYIAPATPVTLSAFDPTVNGVASGVDRIEASIDGAAYATYASTLTFAEGRHTVLFRAVDRAGNVEAAHTLLLQSDNTAPLTAFQPSGAYFSADGRSYAPLAFTYALPAQDPVVSGVASGVALTRYRAGQVTNFASSHSYEPGSFQAFAAPLSFAEGIRRVDFQSQDNVGNLELLKSATVFVDATAPVTALSVGGPTFDPGSGRPVFIAAQTLLSLSAVDPTVQEVASGVNAISFRRDADPFAAYSSSFTLPLPDGFKTVAWYAVDNVGNQELSKATTVFLDNTPPQTGLAVIGGHQFPGPDAVTFYASSDTRLALPAFDPIVGGAASGLAFTQYQDNAGAFQTVAVPFGLAEGAHALGYRSQDKVQNTEVASSTNVWVDATPPASAFAFGAPYYQAPDGTNYITPATPVTFTAKDPVLPSGQPGAGVNRIEVAVDGGPFAVYTSSLTFAEGRHTILYRSIDNVANVEATRTLNVQSDATPPLTTLAALGGHQFPGPDAVSFFASADTRYSLPAVDPFVKNVASGVSFTRWQDNGGAFQMFGAAPALAEGVHHLAYQSQDNVSNLEVLRSTTALVDATPPQTSLLVSGGRQFAGPDASTFYASSDTRLVLISTDPLVNGVASGVAFTRWQDNGGAFMTYVSSLTLAEGAHAFAYQSADNVANLETPRSTNVWVDATPPVTSVSIGLPTFTAVDGTIYVATATPIAFAAADPALPTGQTGSGLNRIETSLDGAPFARYAAALTLAEGRHVISYRAVDNVGNVELAHSISIQSDATPPVSALVIGVPQFQLPGGLLVSSRTPFSIAAVDPVTNNVASGVKDTYSRVSDVAPSSAAFALSSAPFTLAGADVNKVVEFFSRDNVLNTEVVKSSTVLLDSTPPEVALLSPAACDSGICRVLKGKFSVLGTARDPHFGNYRLEFAAGQNATAVFTLISSGTVAVSSGALGTWDASKLSGWLSLRLTATDLVQNVSSLTLNVFVGDPGELLLLGNHELFNMPEGAAVGADGTIYVADTNNDRVAVFSSTGTMLAAFGTHGGDDQRVSTGTLRLNKPAVVAVDASGAIYVADTNNNRVLKLSATGQILLDIGARKAEKNGDVDFEDGAGPGQFLHPKGVALDGAGDIYVADTYNHRVQVFNSSGTFLRQFALPAVVKAKAGDEGDDEDKTSDLGTPFGVAVDGAGDVYAADPKGHRALKFDATGKLLLSLPAVGDHGEPGQPAGVAVTASGDCLLVSDRKLDRVLKYDLQGGQNLLFGVLGKLKDDAAPEGIVFKRPLGLALDAQGNLFVADRDNERIEKFGLPTGQAPLIVPPPGPEDPDTARDVVDKNEGGEVARADHAAVDIPAGAAPQDLKVTVSTPSLLSAADEASRQHAVDDKQLKTASPPVEYGPEGTQFAAPVTLTLPYSPDLVALQGIDETSLKVHYWNRTTGKWEDLDSTVDEKNHTITAKTSHFSLYQVFSSTVSTLGLQPLAIGDPTFTYHDAYAFPNPVRGVSAVTIRIQVGLADSVEVHVYDLTGRRVHASSDFTLNTGLDDGNGKGTQYTYDHVWSVSGVGSGVYTYVITAKKAGKSDIHKTGRIGVVK
ncbi:MAG: hypothetical protein KGJ84_04920 [Elusimicrobia bacterium]|nr:hypothetical protein [Elusimicrobiota bacterium]